MLTIADLRKALTGIDAVHKDIYAGNMMEWIYSADFVKRYHGTVLKPDYLIPFSILWDLIKPKRYMVIGVLLGTAESYAIKKTGHHPELIVTCDLDHAGYNPERTNLAHVYRNITCAKYGGFKNELVIVRQDSKIVKSLDKLGPYDLVYVDGSHGDEMVYSDMEIGLRNLAPGGFIIVHDIVNLVGKGFQNWVDAHPECDSDKFEWALYFAGLGVIQRKK